MSKSSSRKGLGRLTHVNRRGEAHMVDVADKPRTRRQAVASARVSMQPATLELISSNQLAKGDVLAAARLAGIQAAKRTWELIPLCHPLPLSAVSVEIELRPPDAVELKATAVVTDRTGVEMEALTAVSVAALTIYDMCKAVDRGMVIGPIQLEEKGGGRSGAWRRPRR